VLVAKICVGRRTWNALYAEIQSAPHAEIYDLFFINNGMNKYKQFIIFFIFVISFLSFSKEADAATITAAQSGNWSATSTWTGGVVPGASDDVQIVVDAAVTITIDQNSQ
jgi:hypothetical protein